MSRMARNAEIVGRIDRGEPLEDLEWEYGISINGLQGIANSYRAKIAGASSSLRRIQLSDAIWARKLLSEGLSLRQAANQLNVLRGELDELLWRSFARPV